jgi:hypothetical protein
MKVRVAITLIVMGTLLLVTPVLADYLYCRNLVHLMTTPGMAGVTLDGKLSKLGHIGYWCIGSVMIGIGTLASTPAGGGRVDEVLTDTGPEDN